MMFEELLDRDGRLVYKTRGISMEPMLRQNRDLVIIQKPIARLKPYDVAFYKRGTSFVLHRVIQVKEDHYLIRGDNTYAMEIVPDQDILGVLTGFQRKRKDISVTNGRYLLYVRVWCAIYPLRWFIVKTKRAIKRCLKHLLKRNG